MKSSVQILSLIVLAGLLACTNPQRVIAAPIVICIDPGHPSEAGRGTAGKHITEIQAAWLVANRMRGILISKGIQVVMTKTSEQQFVTNRARADFANNAHAALMVRLHCDGGNGIGSGFAVYAPDRQGTADGVVGPSAAVIARSQSASKVFYSTMVADLSGQLSARGLHSDTATRIGAKQGALTGSVFAKVPVVLIEMCVLTNPSDEAFISSNKGQDEMAAALADAALHAAEAGRGALTGVHGFYRGPADARLLRAAAGTRNARILQGA
jgi:N-acetylmuramoyl-L-alanine amidase